jgi:hypothetical protein
MLPVQIEAAKTYQEWGGLGPGQEENYMRAIMGARPDNSNPDPAKKGKYVIWGWGEIARMTAGNNKYDEQFYEARYNLALARYLYGLAQKDADQKKEILQMAKRDIAIIAGFYPTLGGDKWKAQFDSLLKNVEKALGERPLGLQGLKKQSSASTKSDGKTVPTSTTSGN